MVNFIQIDKIRELGALQPAFWQRDCHLTTALDAEVWG
jgi:hypothetical protein